jgi:hypothetical protein
MVGNTFFISLCKMSHHGHDDDTFGVHHGALRDFQGSRQECEDVWWSVQFPKNNLKKGVDDQRTDNGFSLNVDRCCLFVRRKRVSHETSTKAPAAQKNRESSLRTMAAMALTSVLAVGAGNCTLTGRAPKRVRLEASELPHPAARRRAPRMEVTQPRDHRTGYRRGRRRSGGGYGGSRGGALDEGSRWPRRTLP